MSDVDDKEKWLKLSDKTQPGVQAGLIEVRATRAAMRGDDAAADAAFADAARLWESQPPGSASLNNAAVAHSARYNVTGNIAHLEAAAKQFDAAIKLAPDSALPIQNLSGNLATIGLLKIVDGYLKVPILAPGRGNAGSLIDMLLQTKHVDEVRKKLRSQRDLARALELTRQVELLAPHELDSYELEKQFMTWVKDGDGLKKLHDRLASGQKIDIAETVALRRRSESGADDDKSREQLAKNKERNAKVIKEAIASGHGPTIAAAHLLAGDSREQQAAVFFDESAWAEAINHGRAAVAAWNTPGTTLSLASYLVSAAVYRAANETPKLKAGLAKRGLGTSAVVEQENVGAAVGARPELDEALKLAEPSIRKGPPFTGTSSWGGQVKPRSAKRPPPRSAIPSSSLVARSTCCCIPAKRTRPPCSPCTRPRENHHDRTRRFQWATHAASRVENSVSYKLVLG